jgi:polysaccharide export outer membrane protein
VTRLANGWLLDPQVVVNVKEYRHMELSVTGAVVKPGLVHPQRNEVTLFDALALANGLSKEAGTRVEVSWPQRGDQPSRQETIDLAPLVTTGRAPDVPLERGCSVVVPEADPFYVSGFVNKPGSFPYRRPVTVSQAVALAGGLDEKRASASEVYIKRGSDGSIVHVDLGDVSAAKAIDPVLEPRDTVEVRRTLAWAIFTETLDVVRGFVGFGVSAGTIP